MASLAPKDRDLPILQKAHKEFGSTVVDVAGGLFVRLCHPQRRGGGDIPANAQEMCGIDKARGKYARLFSRLTPSDVLRKSEPDYKLGWNAYRGEGAP